MNDCYKPLCRSLVVVSVALLLVQDLSAASVPHWIAAPKAAAGRTSYFRREIELAKPVTRARLIAAGDAAGIDLYIDGKLLVEVDAYEALTKLDLTAELSGRGMHVIAVRCREANTGAMLFACVQLKFADGTQEIVSSDSSWLASHTAASGWTGLKFNTDEWKACAVRGAVDERLMVPDERRIDLAASDNYEQWRLASGAGESPNPALFSIAPDFRIELVRSAQPGEDSWISLIFDPQGRAIISQEQQGLLRLTLAKDGIAVESVERINDDLKEVRGMAFLGNDLYANANNSKGMYRLPGDAQGNLGKPELLFSTEGGVGHGRNDLTVGPDGMIYSIHGDDVQFVGSAKDYTGHRDGPRAGHLVRFDPATGRLETLVTGLRNPYGIAFNGDGEMFTYDADAEFDMGSPWYRPTRVNHLTIGSDFGWRSVTGQWPPYYPDHPDNAPAALDIGKGSPTAVKFGTRGNFPRRYREALFILDWSYGRILAVHALPHGAGYLCEAETFLKGRPLNVTDLDFGPDGSMYLITGGRKTQSALYRVRFIGDQEATHDRGTNSPRPNAAAAQARARRRELEGLLDSQAMSPAALEQVWQAIGDADPRIRYAARRVVEQQPREVWEQRALGEDNRLSALMALSALARIGDEQGRARLLKRLNKIDLEDAPRSERNLAAWIYRHCLSANANFDPMLAEAIRGRLEKLYPDPDYLVNEQLSQALVLVRSKHFTAKTLGLLNAATEQREQMHYLFVLRNETAGWTPAMRQTYFDVLVQSRRYVGGEGMPGFLERIRKEALAAVPSEVEREQFATLLAREPAAEEEAPVPRSFVRKWNVSDAFEATQKLEGQPDRGRGRVLFGAASCSKCHRAGNVGTPVGPDLTAASSRFSRRDLLESIIEPSKSIAENYRSLQIVTNDGKTHVGRPVLGGDFRSQILRLASDPQRPFEVIEIDKRTIEEERVSAVSWMPDGLLDTLGADEIRDLLSFIEAGGVAE